MRRALVLLALLAATPPPAAAADFVVKPGKETKVVFVSRAPMERFEGKTDRLEGRVTLDPAALGDSIAVRFEVDMTSLDTGLGMRNRHMHENHLETKKYPKAIFDGARILGPPGAALKPGEPATFQAEGTFTLHGVSRPLRIQVEATYRPGEAGGRIDFRTSFSVSLADYQISRPEFLFLKLAESQEVSVSGVAIAAP